VTGQPDASTAADDHRQGDGDRLDRQMGFILEVDRLKQVLRQTVLTQDRRRENDAEHSWHLGLMAVLLSEYAAEAGVDLSRVLQMLLIHDLVEIDAGDTFAYDTVGNADRVRRERAAADRIFALLPADQCQRLRALWEEFEARSSPEARYAAALDRLQPLLLNYHTEGAAWRRHGIRQGQVVERNQHIAAGAPALWQYAVRLIEAATQRGYLRP
jgi:putative hydrolases of HD superfamily